MNFFRGRIISISGIDGSGKTTCIDQLRSHFDKEGKPNRYIWLRYNHYSTKILLVFCRLIGLTHYQKIGNARVGYHDFHHSKILSHLFIWLTFIDTFFISLFLVYVPAILSPSIIICDRWIPDILIDLEIDTHISMIKNTLYGKLFWMLMPSVTKVLVIQRQYDDVLHARVEHEIDKNFQRRFKLYEALSVIPRVSKIDNTEMLEKAVMSVINAVENN